MMAHTSVLAVLGLMHTGGGDFGIPVAGGEEFEDVALALGEAVWVGAGVFAAQVWIAAAHLGEALLGAAGGGVGAEATEGAQCGLDGAEVAAELRDGRV